MFNPNDHVDLLILQNGTKIEATTEPLSHIVVSEHGNIML